MLLLECGARTLYVPLGAPREIDDGRYWIAGAICVRPFGNGRSFSSSSMAARRWPLAEKAATARAPELEQHHSPRPVRRICGPYGTPQESSRPIGGQNLAGDIFELT